MRAKTLLLTGAALVAAAGLSVVSAGYAVSMLERGTEIAVRDRLDQSGHEWAEVHADGLRVVLSGTAPTEAIRFQAMSETGSVVDAARIINETDIRPAKALVPPQFSIELLRNEAGLSVIGLIPAETDRAALLDRLAEIAGDAPVADLLQVADFTPSRNWNDALDYGLEVAAGLPRSKVSIQSGYVAITAITNDAATKRRLENSLPRKAPDALRLSINIAAPRPVITPFTLRYVLDARGGRFDACSADTEASSREIIAAARAAGATGNPYCTVGLGAPSPSWTQAAEAGLAAVGALGEGSLNISDADVALFAVEGTDQRLFDRVVGELETALPAVFSLKAVLPVTEEDDTLGPPEFTATKSPEGLVQLRGRIADGTMRNLADGLAKARFGTDNVYTAVRSVEGLPEGWSLRVLTSIEALAFLENGAVVVTPDTLDLRGTTHRDDANAKLSQLITAKLGETTAFTLDVTFVVPPPPEDEPKDPEDCAEEIVGVLSTNKIRFEPGSATIDPSSSATMDSLAEILKDCGDLRMEIQGHTDSQGREVMNQELSAARAQSVLDELRARRIPTARFTAVGYGEARPIATNSTAEGRETNRRIEFVLIRPEDGEEGPSILDLIADTPGASKPLKPNEEDTDEQN